MPAEIAYINGKVAMAYLGETPWHRLGFSMTGVPTVEEALVVANLNWNVDLRPIVFKSKSSLRLVKIPHKFAVVRDVDDVTLGVVGRTYTAVQNHEGFGVLNTACKEFGLIIETAGALGKGDKVWMLAKMPEAVEPVPGDKVNGYCLIVLGHNGYTPYTGRLTPVRVVCANTLQAALADKNAFVKLVHKRTVVEELEQVETLVTNMVAALKLAGESFQKLARKKMSVKAIDAYIDSVLGIKTDDVSARAARDRDEIQRLVREGQGVQFAPGTAWAAYNAITEFVDHSRAVKSTKMLQQADKSALFGPSALLKQRALKLALAA